MNLAQFLVSEHLRATQFKVCTPPPPPVGTMSQVCDFLKPSINSSIETLSRDCIIYDSFIPLPLLCSMVSNDASQPEKLVSRLIHLNEEYF